MNPQPNPSANHDCSPGRIIAAVIAGLLLVGMIAWAIDRLTLVEKEKEARWLDPASLSIPPSLEPPNHSTPLPPLPPPLSPLPTSQPGKLFLTPAGRSPLVQPGETLDRPLPYASAPPIAPPIATPASPASPLTPPSAPLSLDGKIIRWQQAADHIGQTMTVQGKVTQTYFSTKDQLCFLNFTSKRQGAFFVIIFQEALGVWGSPPDELFKGKTIRVTGTIFQYQDRTQIRVYEKEQIQIVDP